MFPERYVHLEQARRQFGNRVERLGAMLGEGDPLADEAAAVLSTLPPPERQEMLRQLTAGTLPPSAPEPLRHLSEQIHHVPFWVDDERCDRGGTAFLRTGIFGGFVLAFRSLVMGYCSPAGNKPLAFSGRLKTAAPRRLSETSHFVEAVCLPGGMRPGAPGFAAAVRVRLMHAQVRRLLEGSPRWNARERRGPSAAFSGSASSVRRSPMSRQPTWSGAGGCASPTRGWRMPSGASPS